MSLAWACKKPLQGLADVLLVQAATTLNPQPSTLNPQEVGLTVGEVCVEVVLCERRRERRLH